MLVALTTTTDVADPPTLTVAGAAKLVPVIVIAVPPRVEPLDGPTALTVGGGGAGAVRGYGRSALTASQLPELPDRAQTPTRNLLPGASPEVNPLKVGLMLPSCPTDPRPPDPTSTRNART